MSIDDPRLAFYLARKRLIDEWAKLRGEEKRVANELMGSLADAVRDMATQQHGVGTIIERNDGGRTLVAVRVPSETPTETGVDAHVGLGWYPASIRLCDGDGEPAWVGVRVDGLRGRRSPHGALRKRLSSESGLESLLGSQDSLDSNWAVYRYLEFDGAPTAAQIEDLRNDVIRDISSAIPVVARVVAQYVAGTPSGDGSDES